MLPVKRASHAIVARPEPTGVGSGTTCDEEIWPSERVSVYLVSKGPDPAGKIRSFGIRTARTVLMA